MGAWGGLYEVLRGGQPTVDLEIPVLFLDIFGNVNLVDFVIEPELFQQDGDFVPVWRTSGVPCKPELVRYSVIEMEDISQLDVCHCAVLDRAMRSDMSSANVVFTRRKSCRKVRAIYFDRKL